MSVDGSQLPTPDPSTVLASIVAPIAAQATQAATAAVQDTIAQAHAQSLQLIGDLTSRVSANEQAIQDALGRAGGAVVANVESDPTTQRAIVLAIVGGAVLGALIVLVAYLLGNAQAAKVIGGVPAVAGGLALWASKAGVSLPKPAPKPAH